MQEVRVPVSIIAAIYCTKECPHWKYRFENTDLVVDCALFKKEIRRMLDVKQAYEDGDLMGFPVTLRADDCIKAQTSLNEKHEAVLEIP